MTERHQARHKGHDIEIEIENDSVKLTVDGEIVRMVKIDDEYRVTYFPPDPDPIVAAKRYVDRLGKG